MKKNITIRLKEETIKKLYPKMSAWGHNNITAFVTEIVERYANDVPSISIERSRMMLELLYVLTEGEAVSSDIISELKSKHNVKD